MEGILDITILQIGNYHFKLASLISFILFLFCVIVFLRILRKAVYSIKKFDTVKKYTFYSIVKYITLVFASVIGLQILGVDLSVLMAGSAALLVGIGLGLQNLFSDFISGIILLVGSSIKVNDVIEVNSLVCKVKEINFRTTTVYTRDDKYIILPNTDLTKGQLINWTHSEISSRFKIRVGVDYSSDVATVMKIMEHATKVQEGIQKEPKPFVRFVDYGSSSIDFEVYFWSEEVFRVEQIKSDIRVRIFKLFAENNVTIPFPQRVMHIKHDNPNGGRVKTYIDSLR